MKRIGYVGDIHAEDQLLEIALKKLSQENVDIIVAVGDIVDGLGDIERTVALLRDYKVTSVRGNHERWFFANDMRDLPHAHDPRHVSKKAREWLADLPVMFEVPTIAGNLLVCHGLGSDDMACIMPWDDLSLLRYNAGFRNWLALRSMFGASPARFVLNGHSHHRMVRAVENHVIINAGTLCRDHDPSFGLVDFQTSTVYVWPFAPDCTYLEAEKITFDESPPDTRRER